MPTARNAWDMEGSLGLASADLETGSNRRSIWTWATLGSGKLWRHPEVPGACFEARFAAPQHDARRASKDETPRRETIGNAHGQAARTPSAAGADPRPRTGEAR